MKRSELSPYVREVLSMCEVHLRSDELGIVAAQCLKEVRLSSVIRSFVDCLTPDQRGDLLEYLQTGAFAGLYWVWQEPMRFLPVEAPADSATPEKKRGRKKKGDVGYAEGRADDALPPD